MVGPGVKQLGRNDNAFSDHTDVRPTMLALLGLKDSYVHDGRVLAEWLDANALPNGIRQNSSNFIQLAEAYKQMNAPLGRLGLSSLVYANRSITSDDKQYARYLNRMSEITAERDALAARIKSVLNGAAFGNQPVGNGDANGLATTRTRSLPRSRN